MEWPVGEFYRTVTVDLGFDDKLQSTLMAKGETGPAKPRRTAD